MGLAAGLSLAIALGSLAEPAQAAPPPPLLLLEPPCELAASPALPPDLAMELRGAGSPAGAQPRCRGERPPELGALAAPQPAAWEHDDPAGLGLGQADLLAGPLARHAEGAPDPLAALPPASLDPESYGLPPTLNDLVLAYLRYFLGKGRASYARWLSRSGRYRDLIFERLDALGLPRDLLYVAMIESGFNPRAVSPSAAAGLWQFVPRTGRVYGLRVDAWVDERFDPLRCTDAALRHLAELYEHYGSWALSLAAYNGGVGWIDRGVERYNSNDLWALARYEFLPRGVFHYVAKITAAMIVGHNAQALGFGGLEYDSPPALVAVEPPPDLRLSDLARRSGLSEERLHELNPWLLRRRVPPGAPLPRLVLPRGPGDEALLLELQAAGGARARSAPAEAAHVVVLGETLRGLGRLYGVAAERIAETNGLEPGAELLPGMELWIPLEGASLPAGAGGGSKGRRKGKVRVVVSPLRFDYPGREKVYFRVPRGGASLGSVAATFDLEPRQLALWNELEPAARLHSGMVLRLWLPQGAPRPPAALLRAEEVEEVVAGSEQFREELAQQRPGWKSRRRSRRWLYHKVRKGESLPAIAARYGLPAEQLARFNSLRGDRLEAGRVLRVPRAQIGRLRRK